MLIKIRLLVAGDAIGTVSRYAVSWATVVRGIMGYGAKSRLHSNRALNIIIK